jgi:hypothetical protein
MTGTENELHMTMAGTETLNCYVRALKVHPGQTGASAAGLHIGDPGSSAPEGRR